MADRSGDTGALIGQYWWLPLIRGVVALVLGLALVFVPTQAKSALARYFGMYWLATGGTTIFWGLRGARTTRLWPLAGSIGVVGGSILIFNERISSATMLELSLDVFAIFAIITGVLHLAGGYRIPRRSWMGLGRHFFGFATNLDGDHSPKQWEDNPSHRLDKRSDLGLPWRNRDQPSACGGYIIDRGKLLSRRAPLI